MTNWIRPAMALLALPALAEEPRQSLEVQASLMDVSPGTRSLVDGSRLAGAALGVAYRGQLAASGLGHRIHLDLMSLKARPETGMDGTAPKHLQFGWDLIFPTGRWAVYTGFLGVRWRQSIDDQTTDDFRDLNQAGTKSLNNSPKGTKIGGRLGVEYAFRPDVSFFAGYTQTELNKKYNPGWWSLGVNWRGLKF